MNKANVFSIFLILFTSCTSLKDQLRSQDVYDRLSKGFTIEKLPNWEFHGYHDVLNYTPKNLMSVGKEYIYNAITVSKSKAPTDKDLETIVESEIPRQHGRFMATNHKMYTAQTKYGKSIVLTYDSEFDTIKYKTIRQYYKYKGYVYKVFYSAKAKYFDIYYKDAINMMDTFKIVE